LFEKMKKNQRRLNARALDPPHAKANFGRRTASGGTINVAFQLAKLLLQLFGIAVLSRLVAPSDFGLLAMAGTVTAFISIFTDVGLSAATIRRNELTQEIVSTLFFVNVGVGCGLALLTAALAPIAAWFFGDSRITELVIGLALAMPLSAAGAQHGALLARAMRWVSVQSIGFLAQAVGLAGSIALALTLNSGYFALMAQGVISAFVALILQWTFCHWRPTFTFDWGGARSELKFGLYLSGFSVLNYFHRQFDNVLIGWRYGDVELGYYARAYGLLSLPITLINGSLSQAAVPVLSRMEGDKVRWRNAFLHLLTVSAIGSAGMCAVLFVIAGPLINLLLGSKWEAATEIFRYLTVASVLSAATNGCGWAFISLGKTRELFRWSLMASPIFVLSFVVGLPWKGAGVAAAYSIAMAVLAPLYLLYTAHHARFRFVDAGMLLLPPLIVFSFAIVLGDLLIKRVGTLSDYWQVIVSGGAVALFYLGIMLALLRLLPHYRDLWVTFETLVRSRKSVYSSGTSK
jgi:polysaccharide transporter, PST family